MQEAKDRLASLELELASGGSAADTAVADVAPCSGKAKARRKTRRKGSGKIRTLVVGAPETDNDARSEEEEGPTPTPEAGPIPAMLEPPVPIPEPSQPLQKPACNEVDDETPPPPGLLKAAEAPLPTPVHEAAAPEPRPKYDSQEDAQNPYPLAEFLVLGSTPPKTRGRKEDMSPAYPKNLEPTFAEASKLVLALPAPPGWEASGPQDAEHSAEDTAKTREDQNYPDACDKDP